jgi:hypothetical protein
MEFYPRRSKMQNIHVKAQGGGIGLFVGLTGVFSVLKLGGVIDWSWWLVLCPLWIPFVLALVGVLVGFLWYYGKGR